MQTRGGTVSSYLTAEEWEALEKYVADNPDKSRHSVIKAALRAYLGLDK